MNRDRMNGGWKQLRAHPRRNWGHGDEEFADAFEIRRSHLAKVLDKHGFAREESEISMDWQKRYKEKRKKDH